PYRADLLRVVEAEVRPTVAAVGGAIDAVAVGQIFTETVFSSADVDDVRVGRGDRDRADGGDLGRAAFHASVGDVAPRLAAVGGLPHAAVRRAEVEDARVNGIAGDSDGASAAIRADVSPAKRAIG